MSERTLTVNALAAKTWYWLKMNDSSLRVETPAALPYALEGAWSGAADIEDCATGMGADLDRLLAEGQPNHLAHTAKAGEPERIRLHLQPKEGSSALSVAIRAEDGANLTVVMDCEQPAGAEAVTAVVQTRLSLGKGAKIHLVQLWLQEPQETVLSDVGAICDEGADFALSQLYLGADKVFTGAEIALVGKKSQTELRQTYQAKGQQRYDFNDNVRHIGRKTVCRIDVDGVLEDSASKLFRGTIDLQKGAVGADGAEY